VENPKFLKEPKYPLRSSGTCSWGYTVSKYHLKDLHFNLLLSSCRDSKFSTFIDFAFQDGLKMMVSNILLGSKGFILIIITLLIKTDTKNSMSAFQKPPAFAKVFNKIFLWVAPRKWVRNCWKIAQYANVLLIKLYLDLLCYYLKAYMI
jgi:hypothetical protein